MNLESVGYVMLSIVSLLWLIECMLSSYRRGVRDGFRKRRRVSIFLNDDGTVASYIAPQNVDLDIIRADRECEQEGGAR